MSGRQGPGYESLAVLFIAMIVVSFFTLSTFPDYDVQRLPRQHHGIMPIAKMLQGEAQDELTQRFQQAVFMLHAGRYEHAIAALHRVLRLAPRLPEAYVNMGYALLGLKRYKAAHDFFMSATNINAYQANAYWGLAVTLENMGDLQGALGAMRIYIHLSKADDPYLRRARSALWEWETQLARGPLPKEEKAFLKRGAQRWQQRNSPQRDAPRADDRWLIR